MSTLLLRADDAGLSPGTNRAIFQASRSCVNISLMAPVPALAHAVELFRNRPNLCLGLHFTLNSEWPNLRWGPVSPPDTVSSLVQNDGTFFPNPWTLPPGHSYRIQEVEKELHAQFDTLRSLDLPIQYLDSHMAVFKTRPDLEDLALQFAAAHGLAYPDTLPSLSHGPYAPDLETNLNRWRHLLLHLNSQPHLAIFHPAQADGIMETLHPDPSILASRSAEYSLLASETFTRLLQETNTQSLRIDSLRHP